MVHVHISVIYAVECSLMCCLKACFHVRVMCVKQLLVGSGNWRDILNYIVINVHSSGVSAINCSIIRVKRFQWFINTGSVHIYRICVLKSSVCCRCVINNVKRGCFSTNSVVRNVLIIGPYDATFFCCETQNFWNWYCSFLYFKPISRSSVLPRISLVVTNKWANCWNPLSLVWNCMEGTVSVCNLCDTEGGVKEKCGKTGVSGSP